MVIGHLSICDDVVVSTGAVVAIRAAVMSVETLKFVKRVERSVPKEKHIKFKFANDLVSGISVADIAHAVVEIWRSEKKVDRAHHALAGKCVHAIIKTVTEKAPGTIQAFFGPDLFKPVKL